MAAKVAKSGTLVATVVSTVTLLDEVTFVEVVNRDGAAEIFFRADGVDPTVGGDDCYCLPGAGALVVAARANPCVVKLISSGGPTFTVQVSAGV